MRRRFGGGERSYSRGLPVRPWMEPDRPDMMAPIMRSPREGGLGLKSGTSIASLSMRAEWEREWWRLWESWMRTLF